MKDGKLDLSKLEEHEKAQVLLEQYKIFMQTTLHFDL